MITSDDSFILSFFVIRLCGAYSVMKFVYLFQESTNVMKCLVLMVGNVLISGM